MAIAKRIPAGSIVLADSGYGIFSVVRTMLAEGHDVLFRLTKSRFKSMQRKAELIEQTATGKRYRRCWKPSSKDRETNPDLPADALTHPPCLTWWASIRNIWSRYDSFWRSPRRCFVEKTMCNQT